MAEVRIATEKLLPSGLTASYTGSLSASNDYLINNDGTVILHFKKSAAVDAVITVETPYTVGGLAVAEQSFTCPATSGDIFAGPFPPNIYNDGDHDLKFSTDDVDGLTVAVLHL